MPDSTTPSGPRAISARSIPRQWRNRQPRIAGRAMIWRGVGPAAPLGMENHRREPLFPGGATGGLAGLCRFQTGPDAAQITAQSLP